MDYDVQVIEAGPGLVGFSGVSDKGVSWLADNIDDIDPPHVSHHHLWTEGRFAYDIIDGILDAGLTIGKDGGQLVRASQ